MLSGSAPAPAALAVPIVSRTNDSAPRAEPVFPPRSRVPVTTGAASGVDNVDNSTLSPRTITLLPAIFVCPNPLPCLAYP